VTKIVRSMAVTAGSFWLCWLDGAFAQSPGDWPMFGRNTANTSNSSEVSISAGNARYST
jgi:hypothetical protein